MAPEVAEVKRALLALPERDRAAVIRAGLMSLDGHVAPGEQDEVDAAWRAEVDSRLVDVLSSAVQLGTFEQTRARFTAKHPA
ncbi:addiction module protein [Microbacterium paludicola]|uniref:addiction module protein n=1 Tax=Microbacterium paludicola TaxID=300019 RepID=UPI00387935D8